MENSSIPLDVQEELKKVHRSLHMKRAMSKLTRVAAELSWNSWDIHLVVDKLYREFDQVMHKGCTTKIRLTEIATAVAQNRRVRHYKFPPRDKVPPNVYFYNKNAQVASSSEPRRQEAPGSSEAAAAGDEHNVRKELVLLDCELSHTEKAMLANLVALDLAIVSEEWREDVTHVVVPSGEDRSCSRKREVLLAILQGKWICNSDWIRASLNEKNLVSEEPYEVDRDLHGLFQGPRKGRNRVEQNMPGLFAGLGFTFSSQLHLDAKVALEELVSIGGGQILDATQLTVSQRRYFVFDEYIRSDPSASVENLNGVFYEMIKEFLHFTDRVPDSRLIGYTKIAKAIASWDAQILDSRGQKVY